MNLCLVEQRQTFYYNIWLEQIVRYSIKYFVYHEKLRADDELAKLIAVSSCKVNFFLYACVCSLQKGTDS